MDERPKKKLTEKEKAFCREFLKCGMNLSEAARRAGYSEKTASAIGHENFRKPHIQDEIQRLRGNVEETVGLTKEMLIIEHLKLAFSSIAHLHNTWIERKSFDQLTTEQKDCIQEISTKVIRSADDLGVPFFIEYVKIKLYDKQKSLDSLSKIMGYDAPAKMQVETNITGFDINIRQV